MCLLLKGRGGKCLGPEAGGKGGSGVQGPRSQGGKGGSCPPPTLFWTMMLIFFFNVLIIARMLAGAQLLHQSVAYQPDFCSFVIVQYSVCVGDKKRFNLPHVGVLLYCDFWSSHHIVYQNFNSKNVALKH